MFRPITYVHLQATRAHKTKITIEIFILSHSEEICYRVPVYSLNLGSKAFTYNLSLLLAAVIEGSSVCLVCRRVMAGRIYALVSWQEECVAF